MTTEYLTVSELSQRIKYTEQSIYNLIYNGTFMEGRHFFKPTPKKILFKWLEVVHWIEGCDSDDGVIKVESNVHPSHSNQAKSRNNIMRSLITI